MPVIEADWPAPTGVRAGTTLRTGGVSEGIYASLNLGAHVGDAPAAVAENRERFTASCKLPGRPQWLQQVHGTDVVVAEQLVPGSAPPAADAIVSFAGTAVLGILTADCLPIVICSHKGPEIAALHCGWRSMAGGIITRTIDTMRSGPSDLMAWLGPAISQPAFEVGDDVRDVFLAGIEDAVRCFAANERGRWQADLFGLARLYLEAAGVERIYGGGLCTFADEARFYSYRRDGQCGRMATFVCRSE